jgi:hypothetical protein
MLAKTDGSTRLNEIIADYLERRKKLEAFDAAVKKERSTHTTGMEELKGQMREILEAMGVASARTDAGTATLSTVDSVKAVDPDAFFAYVWKTGEIELLERRPAKTAVRAFAEEHGKLPPGVSLTTSSSISVTSPREKFNG